MRRLATIALLAIGCNAPSLPASSPDMMPVAGDMTPSGDMVGDMAIPYCQNPWPPTDGGYSGVILAPCGQHTSTGLQCFLCGGYYGCSFGNGYCTALSLGCTDPACN